MSSHLSKQCLCLWPHSIPVYSSLHISDGPGDSTAYFRHPFQNFLISHPILIGVSSHPWNQMVPHRGPTDTTSTFSLEVLQRPFQAMPFPLTPFYSSLSQSIVYWQKLLLILATVMVPHRSPTNTSRRVHSRPHPILTEVPSNPCDREQCPSTSYTDRSSF